MNTNTNITKINIKRKRILIVDGSGAGKQLAKNLISNGHYVCHLASNTLLNISLSKDNKQRYLSNLTKDIGYFKLFYENQSINKDLIIQLRKQNFDAIIPGTESGVKCAERLSSILQLPGNNPKTSEFRRNKYAMHKRLEEMSLPHIKSKLVTDANQAIKFFLMQNKPVVVKPVDSAGSFGVLVCNSADDILKYFKCFQDSLDVYGNVYNSFLIQEYIDGPEMVVDSFSQHGKHIRGAYFKCIKRSGPKNNLFIYDKYVLQNSIPKKVNNYANDVLTALNFEYGFSHMEIKLSSNGPVLVEVAARPNGASECNQTFNNAIGYSFAETGLASYTSDCVFDSLLKHDYQISQNLCIKFFSSYRNGTCKKITAYETLDKIPSCSEVNFEKTKNKGKVEITTNLINNLGSCIISNNSTEVYDKDVKKVDYIESRHPELLVLCRGEKIKQESLALLENL